MKNEFVPHDIALELKELGYKEGSYAGFISDGFNVFNTVVNYNTNPKLPEYYDVPTFSSAFRWFRKKYNLHAEPYTVNMGAIEYCFCIRDLYSEKYVYDNFVGAGASYGGIFNNPEDAELECLRKLIEIVKEKKIMENLNTIPTAAEFLKSDNGFDDNDMELLAKSLKTENRMDISDICQTMIEFAKLHVEQALKEASEKGKILVNRSMSNGYDYSEHYINKDSILNSYPLTLIK